MDPNKEETELIASTDTEVAMVSPHVYTELDDNKPSHIGQCKWFNNAYGYGFITIWDGDDKGKDIFVHHTGIKPLNSMYKTLKKGEYVTFQIADSEKGQQAVNVRGINNGPLLCDHIPIKKHSKFVQSHDGGVNRVESDGVAGDEWHTIEKHKRPSDNKRRRT